MPYFTLHRNYTLRTMKGLSFQFIKGEPMWIPPICVPDAVAIGAVAVDEPVDVIVDEPVQQASMTPTEREAKLFSAFEFLINRQDRGDFTASGLPHVRKIYEIAGFEVTNKERDTAWQAYLLKRQEAEAESNELA